jgi:hypothetical protein
VRDGKSPGTSGEQVAHQAVAWAAWWGRTRVLTVALFALVIAAGALGASQAAAVEYGHTTITGEYGRTGPTSPGAAGCVLAFQSSENRLYMMGSEKIYGLHWNGVGSVSPLGGEFPIRVPTNGECYGTEPDFTVDQTNGNLYMTPVYEHIFGWDNLGAELSGFPVSFENTYQTCGVATTNTGELWVGDYEAPTSVHKSSAVGGDFGKFELAQNYACKIEVDQTNNDLYALGSFSHVIKQYSAAGNYAPTGVTYAASPEYQQVAFAVNGSTHTLYVPYGRTVRAYDTTNGELKEEIEVGGETLGVAVDEDTDTLFVNDREHEVVKEFPRAVVPKAVTGPPVGNTTVSGTVAPNGAGDIVECFFEYGSAAGNYDLGTKSCDQAVPISTETTVTATLPGLPFEQATHYRVVAKTATLGGTRRGADKSITPHAVEGLTTEPATLVTRTAAQLHASFEGNGEETKYKFQWGIYDPASPESYESESPLTGIGMPTAPPRTPLSLPLAGLTPETTYHFRVVAQNGKGLSKGESVTFQTLPPVQSLTAEPATDVGPRTATLNGSFVGDGDDTTYHFEYGTEPGSYPNTTTVEEIENSAGVEPLEAEITGLELETTYHYRVVATNSLGTTHSQDMTFTSRPAVEGVVTLPASGVTHEEVTLNGKYTGNGHDIRYHFEYGPTTAYGKSTAVVDGGTATGDQPVSATISDFVAYTTYHYRLVAEDTDPSVNGIAHGPDETVETEPALLPEISGTRSSSVTPVDATLEAEINPNRWLTVYRFDYGTDQTYGESTEFTGPIDSDASPHAVSATISDLSPGTLYHYRAVAINFTGTVYGPDHVFFTPAAPVLQELAVGSVGGSSAHLSVSVTPNDAPSSVHFEYGPSIAYGSSTAAASAGEDTASHAVSADLTGLAPGTVYHFRAVATNQYGTTSSPDQTFTTAPGGHPEEEVKPRSCRKGFVLRHGKCVKRHRKHRHHHRGHRHG